MTIVYLSETIVAQHAGARWLSWRTSHARHLVQELADPGGRRRRPAGRLACAPNRAVQPRLDPSLSGAEREESRYGTLLRLASSARAAGDPAAAVKIYQQAIALDRSRTDAYVLLGDTLVELNAFDDAALTYQDA